LYIIGTTFMLGVTTTSLLFFYRVRAVYGNSRIATAFFGFLWVSMLGLSVLVPLSLDGGVSHSSLINLDQIAYRWLYVNQHMGPTRRCIVTKTRSYTSVPIVLNAVNDTLVFLAISFRIVSYTIVGESWGARARSFWSADGLPKLSRGLLQSGQLYYL
jgi:hypothetical protein